MKTQKEGEKMGYNGYTEKKKASNAKYMEKLTRIALWLKPDEKKIIEEKARKENKSVNQFLKDLALNS